MYLYLQRIFDLPAIQCKWQFFCKKLLILQKSDSNFLTLRMAFYLNGKIMFHDNRRRYDTKYLLKSLFHIRVLYIWQPILQLNELFLSLSFRRYDVFQSNLCTVLRRKEAILTNSSSFNLRSKESYGEPGHMSENPCVNHFGKMSTRVNTERAFHSVE